MFAVVQTFPRGASVVSLGCGDENYLGRLVLRAEHDG